MIVTCDHCGARYKLDDSKISGRGAKITCPRCRHVFVVYKDQGAAADAPTAPPPSAASATVAPPAPAPAPPPANLDVHGLDFRKVGIQSWKVKVKIGLVYDFSDYKTLAKYISDGRVTSSDLLSHNGTDWTAIGDLDDVKQHFVDVYVEAERAQAAEAAADAGDSVDAFEDDDMPTNIIGMDDLAGTLGAERASTATGGASPARISEPSGVEELFKTGGASDDAAPRFVDPFEQRKKSRERKVRGGSSGGGAKASAPAAAAAPRKAADQPAEEESSNRGALLLAALVLLLLGGGAWYVTQQGDFGSTNTTTQRDLTPQPPPKGKADPGADDGSGSIVPEDAGDEVEPDDWGIEEEPELIPVVPKEFRNGANPSSNAAPPPTPNSASGGGGATPTPGVAYASMSASDHAQAGWDAYRRGDYSTAVSAFRQAVSMQPGNAEYSGKLGASLLRSGDLAGAQPALQQAASSGYAPAHDFLGDLLAQLGDTPGAIQQYQAYLGTNPGDAARVQQKINRLNGT